MMKMKEQIELFPESNKEKLCDYLQLNRQKPFNFAETAEELGMSVQEVIVAWNNLNKENRLITLGDSPMYVLESLREGQHLADFLTPASKYYREHYYKPMAQQLGFTLHDVLYQYAKYYHVSEPEYWPEAYKGVTK